MFDVEKIRADFPILGREVNGKRLAYLDNGATSQKPRQVIDSIVRYYSEHNANVHRGVHKLSEEATFSYEEARRKVAEFINCSEEEIVFVKNASEALNLVMYSYGMANVSPGDRVSISMMEHHSNFVPWQALAKRRKAKLEFVDIGGDGELVGLEGVSGSKIVSLSHASNMLGTINSVDEICRVAHEGGGIAVIDASQSVPHMPVDVKKMDCDFFAFTGHKMLAPTGIGVLYGKKELLEKMEPFLFGGDMIVEVKKEGCRWNEVPYKFEAGTPNIEGAVGLGAAVDYLNGIGMEEIRKHEVELLSYALGKLRDEVTIYGPLDAEKRTGLISFNVPGVHPHDVATILDEDGIAIRSGHHCAQPLHDRLGLESSARASFYLYNTKEEVDRLVEGIKKVKRVFA
ncbi:MAG TPA: cysteine desulfurase [Candidatus Bilamarchaeaceae archaeon]|nr:cysteine desulfurase [Candidatus Bilamarchaeaceae archaeon]